MMSKGLTEKKRGEITYTPLGERDEISLTIERVRTFLCVPTKSGKRPDDRDIVKFMMLCQSRRLNPWVGDAVLVGYDAKDGPQFSLITMLQSLQKRAEMSGQYDGLSGGIIVERDGVIEEREGQLLCKGETLLAGWCRVYRKDRGRPFYAVSNLAAFDKGFGPWRDNAVGIISKCAKAAALRDAFPVEIGGMYVAEEMDQVERPRNESNNTLDALTARLQHAEPPVESRGELQDEEETQPAT